MSKLRAKDNESIVVIPPGDIPTIQTEKPSVVDEIENINPAQDITDVMDSIGFQEVKDTKDVYANYEQVVYDFMDTVESENHDFTIKVVKVAPGRGNLSSKQVDFFENEIPNEHDIGVKHGSGKYKLFCTGIYDKNNKRRSFVREFILGDIYDTYKTENDKKKASTSLLSSPSGVVEPGINSMQTTLLMMKTIIDMMSPLINNSNNAPKALTPVNTMEDMGGMYKTMNKVMMQNMLDTQQIMTDSVRSNGNLPAVVEDIEEASGVLGVIDRILPMVQSFAPLLLQPKPIRQPVINSMKKTEEYKLLAGNAIAMNKLIAHLDSTEGNEKTDKILKNLNLKRPKAKKPD